MELILEDAIVITMAKDRGEARALLIRDGRIAAVGSGEEVRAADSDGARRRSEVDIALGERGIEPVTGRRHGATAPASGSGDRRFESFLASQLLAEPQDVVVGTNEGPAYRA